MAPNHRRDFLKTAAAGSGLYGLGAAGWLPGLRPVTAAQARLEPAAVRLSDEIEPLVRLLEETPRARLLEEVAARIDRGTSYREVLAALLLAGVRNVQPRPSVGFKFHAVLVVNSAHLASLASPAVDRWLPIFWALDYFKEAQASDMQEGDWTMGWVEESALPEPRNAQAAFLHAMERWDEPAADAAVAALARSAGKNAIYELFFRLGARDFRSIGHKAIFVANSYRTLDAIGWQHAEPVLRSLAYALLNHEGGNPAERDDNADRPYRRNVELLDSIGDDWAGGELRSEATTELLEVLHGGTAEDASRLVVDQLNRGVSPQSIWDALHAGAGELLMRQPGIVALHAVTTTNALSYAFRTAAEDRTRLLMMLQNAAFLPMFREAMGGRGPVRDLRLSDLQAEADSPAAAAESVARIFESVSQDRDRAARATLAYLQSNQDLDPLVQTARRLIFLKGNDAHDYKFSSAVLEDYQHVSPQWRNPVLATAMYSLTGSVAPDNGLVERTRAALADS